MYQASSAKHEHVLSASDSVPITHVMSLGWADAGPTPDPAACQVNNPPPGFVLLPGCKSAGFGQGALAWGPVRPDLPLLRDEFTIWLHVRFFGYVEFCNFAIVDDDSKTQQAWKM